MAICIPHSSYNIFGEIFLNLHLDLYNSNYRMGSRSLIGNVMSMSSVWMLSVRFHTYFSRKWKVWNVWVLGLTLKNQVSSVGVGVGGGGVGGRGGNCPQGREWMSSHTKTYHWNSKWNQHYDNIRIANWFIYSIYSFIYNFTVIHYSKQTSDNTN